MKPTMKFVLLLALAAIVRAADSTPGVCATYKTLGYEGTCTAFRKYIAKDKIVITEHVEHLKELAELVDSACCSSDLPSSDCDGRISDWIQTCHNVCPPPSASGEPVPCY